MKSLRHALCATSLAAAALTFACPALAGEAHADGSSSTKAEACRVAMTLARQGIPGSKVSASHCECLENKADSVPWSCTAFVSYR